jgi:hypothetical protein
MLKSVVSPAVLLKPASVSKTGLGVHADGMVEHDGVVGQAPA